jgi:GNAT superfamily N-acetyltransferase
MTVTLVRTIDRLPTEFAALEADAKADGHAPLTRLAGEFAKDRAMFHATFAAYIDGELAGIGATTDEPTMTTHPTWRMRRLYVHRKFRRQKIAYAIATALLQETAKKVRAVTVHAGSDEAAQFWEAIGFRRVAGSNWSHERATPSATLCV